MGGTSGPVSLCPNCTAGVHELASLLSMLQARRRGADRRLSGSRLLLCSYQHLQVYGLDAAVMAFVSVSSYRLVFEHVSCFQLRWRSCQSHGHTTTVQPRPLVVLPHNTRGLLLGLIHDLQTECTMSSASNTCNCVCSLAVFYPLEDCLRTGVMSCRISHGRSCSGLGLP